MTSAVELKFISDTLSVPPFSKSFSVLQLHDELQPIQILQIVSDVIAYIDEGNPQSPHRGIDIRKEQPEVTVQRFGDFLRMLKFTDAVQDFDTFRQDAFDLKRSLLLDILYFLLKDLAIHKKRAYLSVFLALPDIPPEFAHDDVIMELNRQAEALQEEFKNVHKWLEGLKSNGTNAGLLKREIQQMEEEKQQVNAKIARLKKTVENLGNKDKWLQAAHLLRTEQTSSQNLADKIREQKTQVATAERVLGSAIQNLKDAKTNLAGATPDVLFTKMQEENRMNRFLASENLPKAVEEAKLRFKDLSKMIAQPSLGEHDLQNLEREIQTTNQQIAELAEQKMLKSTTTDANVALFRQQAAILGRKKESAAQKLQALTEESTQVEAELKQKRELANESSNSNILKGEELKKYIADLRTKSTLYKKKKAELAELATENGILARTEEILRNKQDAMKAKIHNAEKKSGVVGYTAAQETLEKVSEKKSEVDEVKGKTLTEISELITTLTNTIQDKKGLLAPIIQELRQLRTQVQEQEGIFAEKKKFYDATMIGVETEAITIEQEIKGFTQDIYNDENRYHYLSCMIRNAEIAQDRVLAEMKSYIGGDEMVELQQKARGFKAYRDLYNKKISEQEHLAKSLKETQKEVKTKHDPNIKQIQLFNSVKKLLSLKLAMTAKRLEEGKEENAGFTQDRLVL